MAMKPELSTDLRAMVREVLRDVVGQRGSAAVESIRLGSDVELAAFISRLMEPAVQERVRSGKLRFTLGAAAPAGASNGVPLTGVITEKTIDRAAAAGAIILAPDAVLTPLARDRARKLGLKIERRS